MKRFYPFLLAATLLLCGLALRYQAATAARQTAAEIEQADRKGEDVAGRLTELARYSSSHGGAGVTVRLEGSYERAVAAAKAHNARAAASGSIYRQAQAACAGRKSARDQAKCNQDFISSRLATGAVEPVPAPDRSQFVRRLSSPPVALDVSGLMLLAGGLSLATAVFLFLRSRL